MKKNLFLIILTIVSFLISQSDVFALNNGEYLINQKGVEISLKQYEIMKELGLQDSEIDVMTEDYYKLYKDLDMVNIVNEETKYFRETFIFDGLGSNTFVEEISEYEYENEIPSNIATPFASYPITKNIETTYKKLNVMAVEAGSTQRLILADLKWKQLPKVRSYDIFAARVANGEIMTDAFGGSMTSTETSFDGNCVVNGTKNYTTSYDKNSAAFNTSSAGVGLGGIGFTGKLNNHSTMCSNDQGMYLSEAKGYSSSLSFKVTKGSTVYVTYQHATKTVDYNSVRRGYSFKSTGLGGVVYFNNSLKDSYDGMQGINITVN